MTRKLVNVLGFFSVFTSLRVVLRSIASFLIENGQSNKLALYNHSVSRNYVVSFDKLPIYQREIVAE